MIAAELCETRADVRDVWEMPADEHHQQRRCVRARDWDAFVAHQAKIRADPTVITRTIVVDGEVVGGIACWGDERNIGYWIGRQFLG